MQSIRELTERTSYGVRSVLDARCSVKVTPGGLRMGCDLTLRMATELPEATANVQVAIREVVERLTGLKVIDRVGHGPLWTAPGRARARQVGNGMINLRAVFSITAGLIFGLVWVWQGIAAAFIVVAFAVLGWLIGLAVWVGGRAASGDIDMSTVRQLISTLFSDTRRSR